MTLQAPPGSTFLKASSVSVASKSPPRVWYLALTSSMSLLKMTSDRSAVKWEAPCSVIHSFEIPTTGTPSLLMHRFSMKTSKLKPYTYVFESTYERDEFFIVLRHVFTSFWQRLLEQNFILAPKYYQWHAHCATQKSIFSLICLDNVEWFLVDLGNTPLKVEKGSLTASGGLREVSNVTQKERSIAFSIMGGSRIDLTFASVYIASIAVAEVSRGIALAPKK